MEALVIRDFCSSDEIVGCIFYDIEGDALHFGPLAIDRRWQGRGYASMLLNFLEEEAHRLGCTCIKMEVVNWRTDIIPFYQKRGFVEECTKPYPPSIANLTRDCYFICFHKNV